MDFLGYRHFSAGYILVRKSTAKRMKKNIKALKYKLAVKKISKELEDLKKSIGGSVGE